MAVLEEAGDAEVKHPEFEVMALESVSTLSMFKIAAFLSLVTQFVRRWRGNGYLSLYRSRSRSSRQTDKQVQNITYNEFLKLLRDGKEVLTAFYNNENVFHILRSLTNK